MFVVMFEGDHPIVKKTYTIVLPKDKPIRAEVFHGEVGSRMEFDDSSLTYTYWKENVPAVKREPRMVEDTDAFTKLVLATVQDWPEKSRWFFQVNEDAGAFEWNEAIKAKVDEIIRPHKTDEEKRFALLAWVASQIRYSGISMGKGEGYTLHPGIMTFDDRAGVCKDIAGMLITMFRAAGWNTYAAMTMAGAKVEDIPADQFNHCVVAVETGEGEYTLYDPTWCPFSREIWSSAEKPQNYVIGTPEGEVLMETPPAPPEDNFVKVVSRGTLDAAGNLKGTLTITGGAYSETNLRWGVVFSRSNAVRSTFEQWIARIAPNARLTSYETTDVLDLGTPFRMTLDYEAPGYAMVDGDGNLYLTPPASRNILSNRRLTDYSTAVNSEERAYGIFLRASRDFQFDESIAVPSGYSLEHAPEVKAVDGDSASFEASVKMAGNSLVTRQRFVIKKKVIPAEEYAGLKAAADGLEAMSEGTVVLAR